MVEMRHGSTSTYRNHGCRCDECKAANTQGHARYMAAHPEQREKARQRNRIARGKDPLDRRALPVHGAQSGLNYHKGRKEPLCEACATFKAARDVIAKAEREAKLRPCGTMAAFRRHYRRGEKPCQACRDAFNLYERMRKK